MNKGVIPAKNAAEIAKKHRLTVPRLMTRILPIVAKRALPPVSNFRVGSVARGLSGSLYFGANVEFRGEALSFTVHAEQSAITNAWMSGEEGIDAIAVNAAPCGYCRQFIKELVTAGTLNVLLPKVRLALPLIEFLPRAFGPRDLGIDGGLMQREHHGLVIDDQDDVARAALDAANMSYAPYSKSYGGVALRTGKRIVRGAYAENAAFNPSMSPLQVALSILNLKREKFDAIQEAVLVGVDDLHVEATRVVLRSVSKVPLRVVRARNSDRPPSR